jgi:hypothetical protein
MKRPLNVSCSEAGTIRLNNIWQDAQTYSAVRETSAKFSLYVGNRKFIDFYKI